MFEQTFKNIDDILYKDAGADSELDYIEQTSWVLFLRYLDELEREKADEAALEGKEYTLILEEQFRWPNWAMPKSGDGKPDHHKAITGSDLVQFVDLKLFPYLAGFKIKSIDNPKSIEYKIGEIFSELNNKIKSGYNLREIIEMTDELPFGSSKDKHELSHLYETKIKNMGNAGRNGGQYYTPRPLIRAMIEVVNPQVGEKIYDAACGSAGFLCEAYAYMYDRMERNTTNLKKLQENTLYGKEKKNLAYIIGVMNMILHGIEAPNIIHTNTLTENIRDIQEKDRYHVILANPPFGGKERKEVQQNFDIKTGETASLFLQHFIKSLKAGGRAGIVIKNTFLSNADNASVSLRKHLLESCNLHTILDMPAGTFLGAGVKTVVLFFTKGEPTQKTWYYQCVPGRSLGKTSPLNDDDLIEFKTLQKTFAESEKSWTFDISNINISNYDLSVKNSNGKVEQSFRSTDEILSEIEVIDEESIDIVNSIKELNMNELQDLFKNQSWPIKRLNQIASNLDSKRIPITQHKRTKGDIPYYGASGIVDYVKDFIFDENLLLVSEDGANLLARTYPIAFSISGKTWVNNHAHVLKFDDTESQRFVEYYLNSIKLDDFISGMAQPKLNQTQLNQIPIPYPIFEVRKKVVNFLDNVILLKKTITEKNNTKKLLINELEVAILKKVFENELIEVE